MPELQRQAASNLQRIIDLFTEALRTHSVPRSSAPNDLAFISLIVNNLPSGQEKIRKLKDSTTKVTRYGENKMQNNYTTYLSGLVNLGWNMLEKAIIPLSSIRFDLEHDI